MPAASSSSIELIKYDCIRLKKIFWAHYQYKKVGFYISEIMPEENIVPDLFDTVDREKHKKTMMVLDRLNIKHSKESINTKVAHQGFGRERKLRQEKISRPFTTNMDEVIN
ncbi:DUF4113 domain-containing protein [Emticicia sp. 21SJ11W-3]|uniref:DUF4113 domain-containing protein n=1 Tax=Emticicia sp. 21SJ11W-3 TaxID=2916755 RepID=UPI00209EB719|nr:DUF4113 domain-containing protein [Emticicia sp. 21SJ11W-3]UTA66667.1 DUF4113 domain-containing protein [Emticicia sp. 21SJ11W-3]